MRTPRDSYIHKHPGSANLYYIRDIPEDVRHLLPPSRSGKPRTKWKISLKSAIRREAAITARKLAAEHDAFIEIGRAPDPLSTLTDHERAAIDSAGGVKGYLDWQNQRGSEAARLADEAESWRDFAAEENSTAEAPDPDWIASKTAALDSERRQIERQLARDVPVAKAIGGSSEKLQKAGLSYVAEAVAKNPSDPAKITLSGIVTAWKNQTSPVAPEQYEYPVKLFEELHGAQPVRSITVDQVREFRDVLSKMPPASGGKFDNMTMQEAVRFADKHNRPRLKPSTARKHFRCLKAMFTFAADDGYVDLNVAAGIKMRRQKEKHVETESVTRRTFSPTEMTALFEGARCKRWRDGVENTWFLRLLTYTGARPEELAQLTAADVKTIAGHVCLHLHDAGDNHIKNRSSVRKVPVHPELLRLGFMMFVRSAADRAYLFASLEADGAGRRYGRMQDRLTRLIDGKVSDDPRLVPYSLRHGFKDAMRLAGAPEEVVEQIMGHSNPVHRTGRGYGNAQIFVMAEWMAKADPFDKRRVVAEFEDGDDVSAPI